MPVTLSIKNVPDDVVRKLRQQAAQHHRSLQGELLAIIEAATAPKEIAIDGLWERVNLLGIASDSDSTQEIRQARDSR